MMRFSMVLIALMLVCRSAHAQDLGEKGEVTLSPICFEIRNMAPYGVTGSIVTNFYADASGIRARHHENFKLESKHFVQFCSSGPFFPGQKLDLQLKTLVPVFECRTGTGGPIVIHGQVNKDGTRKSWADCL